jgi:sigma-B regulation protein RsbU (phosphoserine phosphatase)
MYLTLFYGVIDPPRRRLAYTNAGHPHAFLIHGTGDPVRLGATDPPVGIAGPTAYGQREVDWSPEEDILVLFTDGLCDSLAQEEGVENNGEQRVLSEVMAHREASAEGIVSALFALRAVAPSSVPPDDRTAIVLRT